MNEDKKDMYYETTENGNLRVVFKEITGKFLFKKIWQLLTKHRISFTINHETAINMKTFIGKYL